MLNDLSLFTANGGIKQSSSLRESLVFDSKAVCSCNDCSCLLEYSCCIEIVTSDIATRGAIRLRTQNISFKRNGGVGMIGNLWSKIVRQTVDVRKYALDQTTVVEESEQAWMSRVRIALEDLGSVK